jgi:hypothetical protein
LLRAGFRGSIGFPFNAEELVPIALGKFDF